MADPVADNVELVEIWGRLSVRTAAALQRAGYQTVGQVRAATDDELLRRPNIGRVVLHEVRTVIAGEELPPRPTPRLGRRRETCPHCGGRGVI